MIFGKKTNYNIFRICLPAVILLLLPFIITIKTYRYITKKYDVVSRYLSRLDDYLGMLYRYGNKVLDGYGLHTIYTFGINYGDKEYKATIVRTNTFAKSAEKITNMTTDEQIAALAKGILAEFRESDD